MTIMLPLDGLSIFALAMLCVCFLIIFGKFWGMTCGSAAERRNRDRTRRE